MTPRGEIDRASVRKLRNACDVALVRAGALVIDLAEATFLDAAGLAQLIRADAAARRINCSFALRNVSPLIVRMMEAVGLESRHTSSATTLMVFDAKAQPQRSSGDPAQLRSVAQTGLAGGNDPNA